MALMLSGERTSAAPVSLNPFRYVLAIIGKVRAMAARRQALHDLMALPAHRLDDLGINRTDLFDAMAAEPSRSAKILNDRRHLASSHWLNP